VRLLISSKRKVAEAENILFTDFTIVVVVIYVRYAMVMLLLMLFNVVYGLILRML